MLAFRDSAGLFYRRKKTLEGETRPRVENQRVGPPHCHGNAAIAMFLWQFQGPRSLVLVRKLVALRGPSTYAQICLISSRFASDTHKGLGSIHLLETPLLGLQEIQI